MTEAISHNDLKDAALIDPSQIGAGGEKPKKPIPFLHRAGYNLTEQEVGDLAKINPGKINLDDVKEYATNHVLYYESMGRVRLNPMREKDFREAKMVNSWLNKNRYREAAAFFLQKARKAWSGIGSGATVDRDESTWRIYEPEDVQTIPPNVVRQGDTAIKQFLTQKSLGLTLRMANPNSATYLRQASVLARIINFGNLA